MRPVSLRNAGANSCTVCNRSSRDHRPILVGFEDLGWREVAMIANEGVREGTSNAILLNDQFDLRIDASAAVQAGTRPEGARIGLR